jgi:hypothetical protein
MPTIRYAHSGEPWEGGLIEVPQEVPFALAYESASIMSNDDLKSIGLERVADPVPKEPTMEEIHAEKLVTQLTPVQFHAMMRISGQYDKVLAAIESMPSPDKEIATAKLDYSLSFQRGDPVLKQLQKAVDMSDEQLDSLWVAALSVQ